MINKIFISISISIFAFCLLVSCIAIIDASVLQDYDRVNYLYFIVFPMLFITIFSASKRDLNYKYKHQQTLLKIAGYIGIITVFFFLYSFFEGEVLKKNEKFYQLVSRRFVEIDKDLFLKIFKIQILQKTTRIMLFSYVIFFVNFLIVKSKNPN